MCGRAGKGATFIGVNGKDHMLSKQLKLERNRGVMGGGKWWWWWWVERQGLGNKKTEEIKSKL